MTSSTTFVKASPMPVTAQRLFDWHANPGAFERLAPPWERIRIVERSGGLEAGATLVMQVKKAFLWMTWEARHVECVPGAKFVDVQDKGPFAYWRHEHRFRVAGAGAGAEAGPGSVLEDEVAYRLPLGPVGKLFGGWSARRTVERMFRYRHARTLGDLRRHQRYATRGPQRVVVTGASGLVGSALTAFLRTGGHTVIELVRDRGDLGPDKAYWNPARGEIDAGALEGVDAVVHLAGASIAGARWSAARKALIMDSRVNGTSLIARTLAGLDKPPRVLVSASATGYYGDRSEPVTEDSSAGEGFLAEVCKAWESAAAPAAAAGVRVVHPRFGLVLSPGGGALAKLLTPFKMGVGGRLADGEQAMPWVSIDDAVAIVHAMIFDDALRGPVNAVAPQPTDNLAFTKSLGRVLFRPTILPLPGFAVRALFGEMGEQLLLSGADARPARLEAAGFEFEHRRLEDALRYLLGRE